VASKILTRDQAQARKDAAVRFAENVLDDPDKAADIEAEDLDDWVERKKITLVENPGRRAEKMANGPSKQDLQDQIDDLTQENQDLQDQLDAIVDIVVPPDEDDDTDDDDDLD
jgi:hypothetical protein